ncbi:LacI family transcriptional regulator [Cryobacterium sp. TMT1-62]|uniref:LacI family DNA-binding transcriptional regulator n=1 Tax=unclassified Cryobacterium TaxID=2649013 RepID=UPI00106C55DF|nr:MULTISPECIES: substrate-binding domain-containing protein [unclassified Cryobacterium]TFB58309.1 LacI family transcriptional regulator [Cryobacterium sp. Sr3]TFD31111.1 LacI family transcriptional regulator [Cryobacterium sp. TMT1-62]
MSDFPLLRPIGLALVRATEIMGAEPYFHEFIAGVERAVRPAGYSVLLNVLPDTEAEAKAYRRWSADGEVSGVILVDLTVNDPRPQLVHSLGLPAIVVGPPTAAPGFRAVWTNDDMAMRDAVEYLAGLGHIRIAHVGGPANLLHSQIRRDVFLNECARLGIEPIEQNGDYSRESGGRCISALIRHKKPPTAAILDNDLMALGALDSAQELGISVPGALSLLAWDDSAQCQLSEPSLSAVSHDVQVIGMLAGQGLLEEIVSVSGQSIASPPVVVVARESTGAPILNVSS